MRSLLLLTPAIVVALLAPATSEDRLPTASEMVLLRYKLAALTAMSHQVVGDYERGLDLNPKCVMMRVTAEFSGDFVFFARTYGSDSLEVVAFTPRLDNMNEWAGRDIKYEGEAKKQFDLLHSILSAEARLPKITPEEYPGVLGETELNFDVGDDHKVAWGQLPAGFLANHPDRKSRMIECVKIAEALVDISMPTHLFMRQPTTGNQ